MLEKVNKNYAERLESLMQASVDLNRLLPDTERICENSLELLSRGIAFTSASIQYLQKDNLKIVAYKGFENPDVVQNLRFPLEPTYPNYRVVRDRRSYSIEDTYIDFPHFRDEGWKFDSLKIRSWLGVPLLAEDRVIGLVTLDRDEVLPFSEDDIRLVEAFAGHLATAIRNGWIYSELEEANHTKETLLRELNHRVKNNMQLVSSLIDLKIERTMEQGAVEALQDIRTRILSLAALYNRLHEAGWFGPLEISPYLRSVLGDFQSALMAPDSSVRIEVKGDDATSDTDTLPTLGLIVTELVMNSLKHAFPNGDGGVISVESGKSSEEGCWFLEVSDTGIGISDTGIINSDSLGILLVRTLAQQIDMSLELIEPVNGESGTRWRLEKATPLPVE